MSRTIGSPRSPRPNDEVKLNLIEGLKRRFVQLHTELNAVRNKMVERRDKNEITQGEYKQFQYALTDAKAGFDGIGWYLGDPMHKFSKRAYDDYLTLVKRVENTYDWVKGLGGNSGGGGGGWQWPKVGLPDLSGLGLGGNGFMLVFVIVLLLILVVAK